MLVSSELINDTCGRHGVQFLLRVVLDELVYGIGIDVSVLEEVDFFECFLGEAHLAELVLLPQDSLLQLALVVEQLEESFEFGLP